MPLVTTGGIFNCISGLKHFFALCFVLPGLAFEKLLLIFLQLLVLPAAAMGSVLSPSIVAWARGFASFVGEGHTTTFDTTNGKSNPLIINLLE